MSNTVVGAQAAGAQFGISSDLSYGYIRNLEFDNQAEVTEVENHEGEIVLANIKNRKMQDVSGEYVGYKVASNFDGDLLVAGFEAGTQVAIPESGQLLYVTGVTKTYSETDFVVVRFTGKIWENINSTPSV